MSKEIPLRAATADEFPKLKELADLVFAVNPTDEGDAEFRQWLEYDRTIVADDDGELVATASTHTLRLCDDMFSWPITPSITLHF